LHPIIHEIEPLLKEDEPFTLAESDAEPNGPGPHNLKGPISKCVREGVLRKKGRKRYEGKVRIQYQWVESARKHFLEYLDNLDTLPCGHRHHIPNSSDDPDGIISCKFCGREYDEDVFKELVLDD